MIEWPYTEDILELYEFEYEKALNTTYVRNRRKPVKAMVEYL
jgi:hypothetical protein